MNVLAFIPGACSKASLERTHCGPKGRPLYGQEKTSYPLPDQKVGALLFRGQEQQVATAESILCLHQQLPRKLMGSAEDWVGCAGPRAEQERVWDGSKQRQEVTKE